MQESVRLGFVCLARKAFDFAMASRMAEEARGRLPGVTRNLVVPQEWVIENLQQAASVIATFQSQHVDAVLVLCGTFASAELVLRMVEQLGVPLIIWTVPEPDLGDYLHLNSLVGGNAITSALYKSGYAFKFFYHGVKDEGFYQALRRHLEVLALARALRSMRIGLIGGNRRASRTSSWTSCTSEGRSDFKCIPLSLLTRLPAPGKPRKGPRGTSRGNGSPSIQLTDRRRKSSSPWESSTRL